MKSNLQLHTEAVRLRRDNGYGSTEPIDVVGLLLAQEKYTLIKLPMSDNISGMCVVDGASKIIAVNSNMSLGRQRFTIAHELYHLEIEHVGNGVICKQDGKTDSEREADQFASCFLMPYEALDLFVQKYHVKEWTLDVLVRLSQFFRMSFQAILYRLHQERQINDIQYYEWMKQNVLALVRDMAVDETLYMKSLPEDAERSYGQYGRLLKKAKKEEAVSDSLYRQFAIEGFCDEEYQRWTEEELVYD